MAGTGTPATALLAKQKVEHRVHTYTHRGGQAYGPEAAEALGLESARVFGRAARDVRERSRLSVPQRHGG